MTASHNSQIAKVLEAGQGGTLAEVGGKLIDALELIEQLNYRMWLASIAIAPLADIDWHGKWRIHKMLAQLSMHDEKIALLTMEALASQGKPK